MEHLELSREDILRVYQADSRPWVIGYSGGKDSTAVVRLVFEALQLLPKSKRTKPVYIVSSDTLVETPLVVNLIRDTLASLRVAAAEKGLPIEVADPVTPKVAETFWVNLIGKGYPAPTRQFRWCTERMKIDPVSEFITDKVATHGEVIVVLGSRMQESASRAQVMKKHRIEGSRLARHVSLPNAYVFTPIDLWSADDVWEYLFSGPAPWGGDHQALFDLYKDSNAGECPLVIDTSTPSCGNSRFGCWVCTVVQKDRAMDGLIETGHTWMIPLRDFRNQLHATTSPERKSEFRNARRRDGSITVFVKQEGAEQVGKHVLGPYRLEYRKQLLRQLLENQLLVNENNPGVEYELITKPELERIRVEWRQDPNEPDWEDSVLAIYKGVTGKSLDWDVNDDFIFTGEEARLIDRLCSEQGLPKQLLMKLLELEVSYEGYARRSNLQRELSELLSRDWSEDAIAVRRETDKKVKIGSYVKQEEDLLKKYAELGKVLGDAA
ncbi:MULTISPECIES: DNA phosphorothioation system sulfurtransferase DndC [unclassified Caballeronia]|uniref:DNA phosphorothioation system sulfurtransferase DndC n=1 Tax=unclassified Caballeronia TaxID=2646786 RepID=UPI0020288E95|nr:MULTISPECIES: DNA phosphorothioation system sulfurtransferase DndC [unclassified Caballeronia]